MGAPYRRCLLHQCLFGAVVHLAFLHRAAPVPLPAGAGGIYRVPGWMGGGWGRPSCQGATCVLFAEPGEELGRGYETSEGPFPAFSRQHGGGPRQTAGRQSLPDLHTQPWALAEHPGPLVCIPWGCCTPGFCSPTHGQLCPPAFSQHGEGTGWAHCWPGTPCLGRDGRVPGASRHPAALAARPGRELARAALQHETTGWESITPTNPCGYPPIPYLAAP